MMAGGSSSGLSAEMRVTQDGKAGAHKRTQDELFTILACLPSDKLYRAYLNAYARAKKP